MTGSRASQLVLFAFVLTASILIARTLFRAESVPEEEVRNRPAEIADDGYVSSRKCQACHPNAYATWHASYHRTMTQKANSQTVFAPFDRTLQYAGRSYVLSRKGDELFVEMDDRGAPKGFERRVQRKVVMVTGSHHTQIYWIEAGRDDRAMDVLPLAWLIKDARFAPIGDIFLQPNGNEGFSVGTWNVNCANCHATRPRPNVQGVAQVARGEEAAIRHTAGRVETEVAEFGIACEACHGPGEEHVESNRSPLRRYPLHVTGSADATIVNPARLSRRKSSEVCGQCHSITFFDLENLNRWISEGRRYKPGSDLHAVRTIVQTPEDEVMVENARDVPRFYESHFWSDGMPRVSGREYNSLIASECYKQGDLSCLDCHSLHQTDDDRRPISEWRADQLKPGMRGEAACASCHPKVAADPAAHSHHAADTAGSDCQNCHMPHTTYGLLQALRSHDITSPSVQESLEVGRPNACNLCHLDRTLDWTAEALESWYGIERPVMDADQHSVAASVLWALKGDAGQRALAAWHMGWGPARDVAGTQWIAPYLGHLLDDPYAAVRFLAQRSLRTLDGFEDLEYEYVGTDSHRRAAREQALARWGERRDASVGPQASALLMDAKGQLRGAAFDRLARQRNNRSMNLLE